MRVDCQTKINIIEYYKSRKYIFILNIYIFNLFNLTTFKNNKAIVSK